MNIPWWTLPGPASYIDAIARDIRDGVNVVLALPEGDFDGLSSALREALGEAYDWEHLDLDGGIDRSPAEMIYARFVPDRRPDGIYSPQHLAEEASFVNRLVWIEGLTNEAWPRWSIFLGEYAHSVRSKRPSDRSLFCLKIQGELATRPPTSDVCLAIHTWQSVLDDTDMLLHVARLLRGEDGNSLRRRLHIALICALAGNDRELAETLLPANVEDLLQPLPLLRKIAQRRGWTSQRPPQEWYAGTVFDSEGREQTHTLLLALDENETELMCRVWKAEVTVLFPFVEQCRRGLLEELKGRLRVPFDTPFGTITDANDLEFGHILSQMEGNLVASSGEQRQRTRRLRDIRNALAHFEPLTADHLRGLI